MSELLEMRIRHVLSHYIDPYLGCNLFDSNVFRGLTCTEDEACITLRFGFPLGDAVEVLKEQVSALLSQELALEKRVVFSTHTNIRGHAVQAELSPLPNIKNIILVGSGKGGVGKSTTATNLAVSLSKLGARVGLLDADIYGPSQPILLGLSDRPEVNSDNKFIPHLAHGIVSMSMGYLLTPDAPVVWRGPMVSSALQQLLNETAWGLLDYLIVDLPPGTGDIQLTLAQKVPVSGAVIVTTPQDVALTDAVKAAQMFQKVSIPVLGVIQNMGVHICSACGHQDHIFGEGGALKISEKLGVPFLGELPLDPQICMQSDKGRPVVLEVGQEKIADLYRELAIKMAAKLSLKPVNHSAVFSKIVLNPS